MSEPILVWEMPAAWGLPNPSPFCMKLRAWLNLVDIPFEARNLNRPPRSRSGKVPYIERADGTLLSETATIISVVGRERGVDLDQGLTKQQRATSTLLTRLLENHLYWISLLERWADDGQWPKVRDAYFGAVPRGFRHAVTPFIRRQALRDAWGHGAARLNEADRQARAREDVESLAAVLGEQQHFLGTERPTTVDATATAFLANLLGTPFDTPLRTIVRQHDNLLDYTARMSPRCFDGWSPPGLA